MALSLLLSFPPAFDPSPPARRENAERRVTDLNLARREISGARGIAIAQISLGNGATPQDRLPPA
jgi:hypothetical protein